MTKKLYTSKTGLYSIRLKSDLIHEGITIDEVSSLLKSYQERYNDPAIEWPFELGQLKVEEFSGTYVLQFKR